MFTTSSKFLEATPNSLSIILVKFEDHRSNASHKMTQYGKHRIFRGIFFESLKTDSKFQMVRIYPSMCRRIFGNVFKLKGHNLENTESSAEYSVLSRYFNSSWTVFPKTLRLTDGYILTIWNSLESVVNFWKILRNIPCFPDCVI